MFRVSILNFWLMGGHSSDAVKKKSARMDSMMDGRALTQGHGEGAPATIADLTHSDHAAMVAGGIETASPGVAQVRPGVPAFMKSRTDLQRDISSAQTTPLRLAEAR